MFYFPEQLIKKHDILMILLTKTAIEYESSYIYEKDSLFQLFIFYNISGNSLISGISW